MKNLGGLLFVGFSFLITNSAFAQFQNNPIGVLMTGSVVAGHCTQIVDSNTIQDSGDNCGNVGMGQVNNGAAGTLGYYATTGVAISPLTPTGDLSFAGTAFTINPGVVTSGKLGTSLVFTGNPSAPTQSVADNSTRLATTAYVQSQGYLTGTNFIASGPLSFNSGTITLSLTGPSNLTTFTANNIPKGNGTSAFAASTINDGGVGIVITGATGGPQGSGTINATNLFVNGTAVGTGSGGISGLTSGQVGVAGSSTTLNSSVPFGTTGNSTLAQTNSSGQLVSGIMPAFTGDATSSAGSTALTLATVNANIGQFAVPTLNAKGLAIAGANLSGDLTTSGATATLNNVNANVGTFAASTLNAKGLATAGANLSGDITTSGSVATLPNVNVSSGTFAAFTANAKGQVTAGFNMTGDVTTIGAEATLSSTGVSAGTYQFGTACAVVDAKGRLTSITVATCGGTDLTADDGTTVLTADDGATALTAS